VGSGALTYSIVQIFDDSYQLLHNVSVQDPSFVFAAGNWSSLIDSHEAYITEWNTLIVPAYNITPWDLSSVGGPTDGWLMDSVFYEVTIPEGEILYTWRSSDEIPVTDAFVPLDALYGFGNSTGWAWDYFHINSIQPWGDDGYVVSGRNTYDILFVNRTTNSVQWRLRGNDGGEFELDEAGRFSYQHHARLHLADGELLLSLFDNNNSIDPPYVSSEGHLLVMDLETRTAKTKTVYVNRTALVAAQFGGSMQTELFGNDKYVTVGHGSQPVTEEYDLDGTLRMTFRFGLAIPGGAPPGIANYRAFKSTWKGYPTTLPSIKACTTAQGTDVFVSW
jgi:flagellar basal body rod protein FlgG